MNTVDENLMEDEQTRAWAQRWKAEWTVNWSAGTLHNVLPLYAVNAEFRSIAHREADIGHVAIGAVFDTFQAGATNVDCRFGEPLVEGRRAVLEWWASWIEDGEAMSMAGCSSLRFDSSGLVVSSREYWNISEGKSEPYEHW
ncbi:MAG: nuclear transport factor 2 family protein [Thermoleophilia bacterium]|nr:nuclear transport factor 2 family protein [Thermoleophilia bacterium]